MCSRQGRPSASSLPTFHPEISSSHKALDLGLPVCVGTSGLKSGGPSCSSACRSPLVPPEENDLEPFVRVRSCKMN